MNRQTAQRRTAARPHRAFVAVRRYSAAREVACHQCGISYGPVAVATSRRILVFYPTPDGAERISMERGVRVSFEISEGDRRSAGFLDPQTQRVGQQEGYHTRMAQTAVRRAVGLLEEPDR